MQNALRSYEAYTDHLRNMPGTTKSLRTAVERTTQMSDAMLKKHFKYENRHPKRSKIKENRCPAGSKIKENRGPEGSKIKERRLEGSCNSFWASLERLGAKLLLGKSRPDHSEPIL